MKFRPPKSYKLDIPILLLAASCWAAGTSSGQTPEMLDLLDKSRLYEQRLEDRIGILEERYAESLEKTQTYRRLYGEGLIARIQLEEQEEKLTEIESELAQDRDRLRQSRQLRMEILALEESSIPEETMLVYRSAGSGQWDLSDLPALSIFYENRFGEALPISARGQTAVHSELGFDHRSGVDLALHPDSNAGKAVIVYLQQQKIPFVAFRAAVNGSATGAHIHVGAPSARIGGKN